ncbi:gustatory receptor-like Holozoa isoform X2 [Oratosquilla oratoria]
MLSFCGYRAWKRDGSDMCLCVQTVNKLYMTLVCLSLALGFIFQYDTCFRRDKGFVAVHNEGINTTDLYSDPNEGKCPEDSVFSYVFPNSLLILAYLVTCYIVRYGEAEHLQTLPERVYLITFCSPCEVMKQRRLGCMWMLWLLFAALCVALSLAAMILHYLAAQHITYTFYEPETKAWRIVLICVMIWSLLMSDVALIVAILLYCLQAMLLSTLLDIINHTLIQGASSLHVIKKQIDESTRFLRHLNQDLSIGVGLFLMLAVFRLVCGSAEIVSLLKSIEHSHNAQNYIRLLSLISAGKLDFHDFVEQVILSSNKSDVPENIRNNLIDLYACDTGYRDLELCIFSNKYKGLGESMVMLQAVQVSACILNTLPWLLLLMVPLIMAAKVTSAYRKLSKVGSQLHARPFGYQQTTQQDLDSFLLYVSSLELRAKILFIPIRTSALVGLVVLGTLVGLIYGKLNV